VLQKLSMSHPGFDGDFLRGTQDGSFDAERDDWACALYATRTAWMRAYERGPTGSAL
jgi:hypothetical protein